MHFSFLKTLVLLFCFSVFTIFSLGAEDNKTLRFGVLSDADSLPFLVADAENLFAQAKVDVKLTYFKSPIERDAAFQAGAVDGIVGDTLGAAFSRSNGFDVKITSLTDGRYGLVTSPQSGIKSLKDLTDVPIGTSTNTIIQYFINTALTSQGLTPGQIKYLAVPKMPLRLEMVLNGQLKAAALPEPLLTAAVKRGAVLLANSNSNVIAAGVVLFRSNYISTHKEALSNFYKAYAKAAANINAHNDMYRDFLVTKAGFPEEVKTSYEFVKYAPPRLPAVKDVQNVLDWLKAQKLVTLELKAADLLDSTSQSVQP